MLRLYHCALYAEGAWTVPLGKPKTEELSKLESFVRLLNTEEDDEF
jgi:hypothetical protein